MKRLIVLCVVVIVSVVAASASAAMVDDFESYTPGAALVGQGGWLGWSSPAFQKVTPDSVSGYTAAYGAVLDGAQSAVVKDLGTGGVRRPFSVPEVALLGTHGTVSILAKPEIATQPTAIHMEGSSAGFGPQFYFRSDGGIEVRFNTGYQIISGASYTAMNLYLVDIEMDFTNNLTTYYMEDITAGTPKVTLATGTTPTLGTGLANITLVGYNGGVLMFDDLQMVPEPATLVLLGLGGLVLRRRR